MLKLGEKIIKDIYLGDKKIAKVFWGDKLVYQAGKPIFLDYIESTGGQRIDTNFKPNQDTTVNITWSESREINYGTTFFGTRDSSSPTNAFVLWGAGAGYWRDQYGNQNFTSTIPRDTKKHTLIKDKNKTYLDGELLKEHTYTEFNCSHNMYLFCINEGGEAKYQGNVKIYSCLIYDNGVLVRDLRPCLDPKGIVCMYDMVTKKYFYNQGTGTLTAGNKIKFVDYIITDGSSYIDTEFYPSANTYIEYTFEVTQKPAGNFNGLFGSRVGTGSYPYNVFATKAQTFRIDYGKYDETAYPFKLNTKYTMKAGNNEVYINNELVKSYTDSYQGASHHSMYLGNFNNAGTPYTIGTPQKIYPCPIYENGVLVRDFRPCVVAGEAGFYDMVTGNLFYNQGTGTLGYMEK